MSAKEVIECLVLRKTLLSFPKTISARNPVFPENHIRA
jgi:hypothetical protein